MTPPPSDASLGERVQQIEWYHTLELAPDVVTPGWFDTRPIADALPFPALTGKRCLDVGSFDGFWAFELERRGASEVIGVDVLDPYQWDWPVNCDDAVVASIAARKGAGDGFLIAREALGSSVQRIEGSVYDLPELGIGTFDFVYVGSLLLHLRDPIGALESVRAVTSGLALFVDAIDLPLTILHRDRPVASLDGVGRPWWWKPNAAALQRMIEAAGFELTQAPYRFYMPPGAGQPLPTARIRQVLTRAGRELLVQQRRGDPHAAMLARPVGAGAAPRPAT